MPGSLAEYLAKNYLTADPVTERPKKKRKKTKAIDTAGSGLIIADDDPPDIRSLGNTGEDDEDRPYFDTSAKTTEFRRAKKSSWKTIGGPTRGEGGSEQESADAILADAAAERAAQQDPDDEDALMIENEDDGAGRMESGARGGLQTAAQTAAMVKAQEKRRKAEEAQYRDPSAVNQKTQETIYRDASGRIINVAMKRAEARRAEEEKREKEEQAREALMGDVQRKQREERRRELQEIKAMPLARTIEDEEMNEDMRARDRWNDPAAEFLTARRDAGASVTGRPLYRGSFQPNRYGIRPGHRWDGVDRGNGFEKDWFTSRNKKSRFEALEYQWQMDE